MRSYAHDPNRIKTFFLDPTPDYEVEVYRSSHYTKELKCPLSAYKGGCHTADTRVGVRTFQDQKPVGGFLTRDEAEALYGLIVFPTQCKCGYAFANDDHWGHRQSQIYQRRDDPKQKYPLHETPVGATYFVSHYERYPHMCGADGHALFVVLPGRHIWHVDGRCSNCTRKDDTVHKCWQRTGDPTAASVTVGKWGDTCSAGAGSIFVDNWHGFLTEGYLHV